MFSTVSKDTTGMKWFKTAIFQVQDFKFMKSEKT